jgi:hypothetical protein
VHIHVTEFIHTTALTLIDVTDAVDHRDRRAHHPRVTVLSPDIERERGKRE